MEQISLRAWCFSGFSVIVQPTAELWFHLKNNFVLFITTREQCFVVFDLPGVLFGVRSPGRQMLRCTERNPTGRTR